MLGKIGIFRGKSFEKYFYLRNSQENSAGKKCKKSAPKIFCVRDQNASNTTHYWTLVSFFSSFFVFIFENNFSRFFLTHTLAIKIARWQHEQLQWLVIAE
jgi:hypothetical protein